MLYCQRFGVVRTQLLFETPCLIDVEKVGLRPSEPIERRMTNNKLDALDGDRGRPVSERGE